MARNETSRLKITIDIDKATGKILQFNQTLGNTEKKVQQRGTAMRTMATPTNQAGQSAAASAVNFQTFSMGLLNLSTSAVQTWTSISNLDRAVNRHKMSVIAVARAQDLLAKAMTNIESLSGNSDYNDKASSVIEKLNAQKDKFFFQSLAGLPLANLLFKASEKMISDQIDFRKKDFTKLKNS